MLTLREVSVAFGERTLFREAALQVNAGDRVGLVGPNGAGKSTLFRLIVGEVQPDTGTISVLKGTRIGYLPQETAPVTDDTVLDFVAAGVDEHATDAEPRAKTILARLAFRQADFTRPIRELSGGWVMRAHLARLLVQEPDLLLLDEPTNHLDLETLLWFQEHLQNSRGAILAVSHDREFLNRLVASIVAIQHGRLVPYRGNYDAYLTQRAARDKQQLAAYKNQQRKIEQLQRFVDRFRAKNTKATQAQSKLKQIERMERIEPPEAPEATIRFHFPQPTRSGLRVISLRGVGHAYGDTVVYRGVDFEAQRGQRIVLVGPNGAGKSTLLKLLAGTLPVQTGTRELGANVTAGYYAQYRTETLDASRSVLAEALDTPHALREVDVRTLLGCFLYRGDDVFKPVGVLSGGEKSRLALVKLLLNPPNLLLMDEPTTHLDLASVEVVIDALRRFTGTIVFISHDVYFIRAIANHVVRVQAGQLTHYCGTYDYYLDKARGEAVTEDPVEEQKPVAENTRRKTQEQKRREAEERQARYRTRREYERRLAEVEEEICTLEARQKELVALLEKPEVHTNAAKTMECSRELTTVTSRLKDLGPQWEKLALKIHEDNQAVAAN